MTDRAIAMALGSIWAEMTGGASGPDSATPCPWLDRFATDAERSLAFMPAGHVGATRRPIQRGPLPAGRSVFEEELPLVDASTRPYPSSVHALEACRKPARNADGTLGGSWRPAAGSSSLVPKTGRGVWARFETRRSGTGRPFFKGAADGLAARHPQLHPRRLDGCAAFPAHPNEAGS